MQKKRRRKRYEVVGGPWCGMKVPRRNDPDSIFHNDVFAVDHELEDDIIHVYQFVRDRKRNMRYWTYIGENGFPQGQPPLIKHLPFEGIT